MHYNKTHINFRGISLMPVNFMWPFQSPDVTVVHIYITIQDASSVYFSRRKNYRHKFIRLQILKFNPYVPIWPFALLQNMNIIECDHSLLDKYTGCNRRNGPDFGRVLLMLNYTEKPQNTYIQSSMVTEI